MAGYFISMLSEKRWRLEAVLFVAMALLLSISLGSALRSWLEQHAVIQSPSAQSFYGFLIGAVSFQGAAFVLVHFFLKSHQVTWKEFLGLNAETWKRALKLAIITSILVIPLTMLMKEGCALLVTYLSGKPEEQLAVQVFTKTVGWGQRVNFGLAAVVLAPIAEEILFRGVLYSVVKQYAGPMFALSSTSLLFAAIHANLISFLPLTVLAMVLVWLYEETGGLVGPIVTHALSNAVNFSLLLIQTSK